jgi:hypothetical protein
MSATSSSTVRAGTDGWAVSTVDEVAANVTALKSFCGSYGTFSNRLGFTA